MSLKHTNHMHLGVKSALAKKVPTADNISDILTKAMGRKTLNTHLKTMGFVGVQASKLHKQS